MNCILLPALADNSIQGYASKLPATPNLIEGKGGAAPHRYTITDTNQVSHIKNVLKAQVGDAIKVGIKSGCLGTAIIEHIDGEHVELTQIDCQVMPPAKLDLTVVLALCRPKVLRRLIMDMTAIGVRRIVLVNSYRTQKSYWQSPMLKRLDEFVDAGLSQGVDTIAPVIECHKRFKPFVEDVLSQWTYDKPNQHAIVAHPYANKSLHDYLSYDNTANDATIRGLPQIICIGAEGGWIDYEVSLLKAHGCTPVSLGRRILRTEAMVNVLCGRYIGQGA